MAKRKGVLFNQLYKATMQHESNWTL